MTAIDYYRGSDPFQFDRVRAMSPAKANGRIDLETERLLKGLENSGPEAIRQRLNELSKEWDIDRVLMVNFSVIVFAQLLAARKNKKWLWGPLFQTPFLFMHATLGWCPPVLWFRPLGFRTKQEIQAEREALLKLLEKPTPSPMEYDYSGGPYEADYL